MQLGTAEIAQRLDLSRETVRTHVRSILRKLRVHTREEAVAAVKTRPHALRVKEPEAAAAAARTLWA